MPAFLRIVPFVLLLGCATTPVAPAPAAAPELAPTPYTADQIRDATQVGRTYEFKREEAGKPAMVRTITFTRVSPTDTEYKVTTNDEAGKAVEPPETTTSTWEELRKHAAFPTSIVTLTEESITVPAGKYDCRVYRVKGEGGSTKFYFAKSLPGPPVLYFSEKDGQRVMTSTLVRYSAGG